MTDLNGEFVENILHNVLDKTPNATTNLSGPTTVDPLLKDFTDSFFSDDDATPDENSCKHILYTELGSTNIRAWDLLIFLPTSVFFIFLLFRFRHARQKLRATNSPIFRAFYGLVILSSSVSVLRCIVSMTVSAANPVGDVTDKLLWLMLRFFLLATEMSVLVFGVGAGHLDSRSSIRRVIIVTSLVSFAFSLTQGILEIGSPSPLFHVESKHYDLFGHGGMLFWLVSSFLFALVYAVILCLPLLPLRHSLSLPHKRSFYYYCSVLLILNIVQATGSIMLYNKIGAGLCFLNLGTYIYFTCFTPIVYFTFLSQFFKVAQPTLLFSYKAQVDEFEDDLPHSTSIQFTDGLEQDQNPIVINNSTRFVANNDPFQGSGLVSPDSVNMNF